MSTKGDLRKQKGNYSKADCHVWTEEDTELLLKVTRYNDRKVYDVNIALRFLIGLG